MLSLQTCTNYYCWPTKTQFWKIIFENNNSVYQFGTIETKNRIVITKSSLLFNFACCVIDSCHLNRILEGPNQRNNDPRKSKWNGTIAQQMIHHFRLHILKFEEKMVVDKCFKVQVHCQPLVEVSPNSCVTWSLFLNLPTLCY